MPQPEIGIGRVAARAFRPSMQHLWTALACLALMAASGVFRSPWPFVRVPYYLQFHLLAEVSSIVVSFAVFATAWYGYRRSASLRDLILSVTFLATGMLDLIHVLSYKGMPPFLSVNDAGTAAGYWLLARAIVGVGLVAASRVSRARQGGWLAAAGAIAVAVGVVWAFAAVMVRFTPESGRWFFDEATGGLTALKVGLEYGIIAIYLVAFVTAREDADWDAQTINLLRHALVVMIFAELAFTLYLSPYGLYNALGHVLKTVAYYLILQALFVSAISRPYAELSSANTELQTLYQQAQHHAEEMQRSLSRIGAALSSSLRLDEALEQIAGLIEDVFSSECIIAVLPSKRTAELKIATARAAKVESSVLQLAREALSAETAVVSESGTMISLPMMYGSSVLGTITVLSKESATFDAPDVNALEVFASQAAVAVYNSLSFERESHIATVLQQSILSAPYYSGSGYEIACSYDPALDGTMVGGDIYDVIEMDGGRIGIVIGDVSGKGVEAAVHAAMIKYTLRAYLRTMPSLAEVMSSLSEAFFGFSDGEKFVTMFVGIIDPAANAMTYVNAGHEPPMYLHNSACEMLEPTGTVIGLSRHSRGYEEGRLTLDPNSTLLMFTDGITEARQGRGLFGSEPVLDLLLASDGGDIRELIARIRAAAVEFAGGVLKDDAVILALRVN